jgi:hypothetical protein
MIFLQWEGWINKMPLCDSPPQYSAQNFVNFVSEKTSPKPNPNMDAKERSWVLGNPLLQVPFMFISS